MMRVLAEDGAIFYNHKWRVQGGLLQDRADIVEGFPVRQVIIWQRNGGINFNPGYFLPTYEVIYLIAKSQIPFGAKSKANARLAIKSKNPHPYPFPVETNVELDTSGAFFFGYTAIAARTENG